MLPFFVFGKTVIQQAKIDETRKIEDIEKAWQGPAHDNHTYIRHPGNPGRVGISIISLTKIINYAPIRVQFNTQKSYGNSNSF
jgi:hypothetical protein